MPIREILVLLKVNAPNIQILTGDCAEFALEFLGPRLHRGSHDFHKFSSARAEVAHTQTYLAAKRRIICHHRRKHLAGSLAEKPLSGLSFAGAAAAQRP